MAPTCQLPIPSSAANRNRCSLTRQETKLQRLKSPGHYAALTSDPLHQPPRAPSPSAHIPEPGLSSLWSPQGLTCGKMKRRERSLKVQGGEKRLETPTANNNETEKIYIKIIGMSLPNRSELSPSGPKAGRAPPHPGWTGLPGQIPRQGPGQGTPLAVHTLSHTRLPGPGRRWQEGAGPQT